MKRSPLKRQVPLTVKPGKPRPCAYCGKRFKGRHEHRNYQQKYCSNGCRSAAQAAPARAAWPDEHTMLGLVNDERLSDSQIGKRYGHTYEWARLVRKAYGIKAVPKPPHREIKHGTFIGQGGFNLRTKGEDRCRSCGSQPQGRGIHGLHLHHAIPRSMCKAIRWDLRNGIPLCRDCHTGWHDRSIVIFRDVFTAAEWRFLCGVELLGQVVETWLDRAYPDRGRPFYEKPL